MNATNHDALLPIGEFARLSQVSVSALRHHHDVGLLVPDHVDRATGYRYYAPDQLGRAAAVVALRRAGMSLSDIGAVLDTSDPHHLRAALDDHRGRLAAELTQTHRRLAMVEALITQDTDAMFDISIEDIPVTRVVYERLEVPSHLSAVTQAATLAGLAERLQRLGITPAAQPMLVIHHADEQRTAEDACLPVADDVDLDDTFEVEVLAGGPMATALHVGSLDDLALVVNAVMGWIVGRGHRVGSPFRIQLLSLPPLFTVASAGGADEPVTKVVVPFT